MSCLIDVYGYDVIIPVICNSDCDISSWWQHVNMIPLLIVVWPGCPCIVHYTLIPTLIIILYNVLLCVTMKYQYLSYIPYTMQLMYHYHVNTLYTNTIHCLLVDHGYNSSTKVTAQTAPLKISTSRIMYYHHISRQISPCEDTVMYSL